MYDETSLISVDPSLRRFVLNTPASSYALQVGESGFLHHLHWGGRIDRNEDLPPVRETICHRHHYPERVAVMRQEYPGWGGAMFSEPALKADLPGGVRNTVLKYQGCEILSENASETLLLTLRDDFHPLEVRLFYRVYRDAEVIDRWSEITNHGDGDVVLRSAMSACWQLPRSDEGYRLTHLAGRWGKEGMIGRLPVTQAKVVLESRTGLSGSFAIPFFALDGHDATETSGRVWFGTLHWSGNWKIAVERDGYEQVSACGGINDFDFAWPLRPGEKFTTPVFSGGYTTGGFGEASRMLHRYQRLHVEPENRRGQVMPVVYNSYAALGSGKNLTAERAMRTMDVAARIGAELFVIDSGWQRAFGEWEADPRKFPDGLNPVIAHCKALGMQFGLWMEIESVDANSGVYRRHPEWLMRFPGRPLVMDGPREMMLLNLSDGAVMEHVHASISRLLRDHAVDFLKIDMNRYFTNPGDGIDGSDTPARQTLWVRHVRNLHEILRRLREEFPNLMIENCAAGAGRSDLGMSRFCGRMNRSDNQDTLDILRLHEGFTWLHPSKLAGGACHISETHPRMVNKRVTSMQYQAYVGMLGSLAISMNLPECPEAVLKELSGHVELYKRLRRVVHLGQLHRLASHHQHPYAVFEYVSEDKQEAVVFFLGHAVQFADKIPAMRLRGLDPDTVYAIEIFGNKPQPEGFTASIMDYAPMSGRGLMEIGVRVELLGDYDARILELRRIR